MSLRLCTFAAALTVLLGLASACDTPEALAADQGPYNSHNGQGGLLKNPPLKTVGACGSSASAEVHL